MNVVKIYFLQRNQNCGNVRTRMFVLTEKRRCTEAVALCTDVVLYHRKTVLCNACYKVV